MTSVFPVIPSPGFQVRSLLGMEFRWIIHFEAIHNPSTVTSTKGNPANAEELKMYITNLCAFVKNLCSYVFKILFY